MNLIRIELAVAILTGLIFIVMYWASPWLKSPAGRHMMAVAFAMTAEAVSLFLVLMGVRIPIWLFVVGYGIIDVVVIHRLVLLWRARRLDHADEAKLRMDRTSN